MAAKSCIVLFVASILAPFAFAGAPGFASGNTFKATSVFGQVSVTCHSGTESKTAVFQCYDFILLPGEYDTFTGPQGSAADQVTLTALRSDRSSMSKSSGYDPVQGKSTGRFNLWVRTLLQVPLLQVGANQVTYSLTKNGREVAGGQFAVTVEKGPGYRCAQPGNYQSPNLADCDNQYTSCQRFFSDINYCLRDHR